MTALALFRGCAAVDLGGVLGVIVGGDHAGSFALGSLLRIVAACPGNWSRDESLGGFGVKLMFMRVPGVAVLQRGVR